MGNQIPEIGFFFLKKRCNTLSDTNNLIQKTEIPFPDFSLILENPTKFDRL